MKDRMRAWSGRGLLLLGVLALGPDRGADGYRLWTTSGGAQEKWRAASPALSWDDSTSTLSWTLTSSGFPSAKLPTLNEAGAALENGFRSIEDITGARIKFRRRPNSTGRLAVGDGVVTVEFHSDAGNHPVAGDISGIFGMVLAVSNSTTGTFTSMDFLFNATQGSAFDWSTAAGDPSTFDVETTHVHEALHAIGLGHTSYFYAGVYQFGRDPEIELHDRCYGPDDRNGVRTLYPEAPALETISGTVALSGGGAVANAVVVATDAAGIPQATAYTNGSGHYTMNVPAGADYQVTAGHVRAIPFDEVDFSPTNFVACSAQTVSTPAAAVNLTATAGTPRMRLVAVDGDFQPLFVNKGFSGSVVLAVDEPGTATFGTADVASLSFGSGITVGTVSAASSGGLNPVTLVTADIDVAGGATAGTRSISLVRTNGERMLVPGAVLVRDAGALVISGTSAAAAVPPSTADHVMLTFDLQASPVEDVRVRRIVFDVTGTGPAVPAVRLWRDADDNDVFEPGTDVRILTSAAYVNAVPDETITYPGGNGQITFDLVALSVPAGRTETFFVTFDFPATGDGNYAVSLSPGGLAGLTHGMFYGGVITPTGGAAGGVMTIGDVGVSALEQRENVGGTPLLPIGGATDQTSVVLRGAVAGTSGDLSMEVEVKAVGTAFDGTGTVSSAPTATSGLEHSITVGPLADAMSFHWRARAVSSVAGPGAWQSFGGNAETAVDFSVDTSSTSIAALDQQTSFSAPLPVGGSSDGFVRLRARVDNTAGSLVRLEVEVRSAGEAFTDEATGASAFVPAGTLTSVPFGGPLSGDYRWQARAVNPFGRASAWADFGSNGTVLDFHLNVVGEISASSGCAGRSSGVGGGEAAFLAGALLLLLGTARRRRWAGAAAALVLTAVAAFAQEPEPLPAALSAEAPEASGSLSVYLGVEFLDLGFDARGTDFGERKLEGVGLATAGLEGLIRLGEDTRLGAAVEAGFWGDARVLSAGPVFAWRIAGRAPEAEHALKLGLMYRHLEVSKSEFGDFEPAFGVRAGYELRLSLGETLGIALAADLRYSVFRYEDDVLSGDDRTGGVGVLLSAALLWLP